MGPKTAKAWSWLAMPMREPSILGMTLCGRSITVSSMHGLTSGFPKHSRLENSGFPQPAMPPFFDSTSGSPQRQKRNIVWEQQNVKSHLHPIFSSRKMTRADPGFVSKIHRSDHHVKY
ncbi:hypothetical protein BDW62DRAFT_191011 [Aspergillus aurantiobrunneus]